VNSGFGGAFSQDSQHAIAVAFGRWEAGGGVGLEQGGMDVALAADGFGVAEDVGDGFDGLDDISFGLALRTRGFEKTERVGGEGGAGPGAEIFGGEILAGDFAEVVVDFLAGDAVGGAVAVDVLKQLVAGEVLAAADDFGQARVMEIDGVFDAAFAFEMEVDFRAVDFHVVVAEGGEAEMVVGLGVFIVADADEGFFEEAHDGGHDFFAREAGEF